MLRSEKQCNFFCIDHGSYLFICFDHIPHDKLLMAVEKHVSERWMLLYLRRWLEALTQLPSGEIRNNTGFGIPQGGVVSPLLSNLFLHYGLDQWFENHIPSVCFSRYADDAIIHCENKLQTDFLLSKIKARMESIGLSLHPKKTQIVYCSDQRRRLKYPNIKFDFLGYYFQPRVTSSRKAKGLFVSYDCAISIKSKKRIADRLDELKVKRLRYKSIVGIAQYLNPMIRGWLNYYGKFRRSNMHPVFRLLHQRIIRSLRYRFKCYKTSIRRAYEWLKRV